MSKRVPLLWLMPLMTCVYAALASAYPYYAMWDSSQVYTLDALLTGAGQLPDHFFHPNMVPLVLYRYLFLPVGVLCGWISVSSITGLQALPNPYLPFAETTIYLIRIGYLFALVFLSFTYLTIFRLLAPQLNAVRGHASWYLALTLTALALVWQYVPFMLIWVRYETIGLALWSIALYATVCAAEAPQRWRGVLLAGFCSGAAVLCKVQLAGGVAMLPFLYVFAQSKAPTLPSVKVRRICTALAIAVAALLALTHGFAYVAFTRHELQRVAFDKFLLAEHFVPIAPSLALLLCGAVAYLLRTAPRHPALAAGAARLSVFAAAFCSVLLLALLIGRTWNERASALCWTYIYSFMLGQLSIGPATGYYRPIDWGAHLPLFVLCAVALAVISFGYLRARERLPRQKLVAGTMAVLIAVLGSTVLLRPDMRKDGLMLGAWLLLASLIVWRLLLALFSPRKMLLLGSVVVWLTVAYQVVGLARLPATCSDSGNEDYSIEAWKDFNYGFRGKQYQTLMAQAYPSEAAWLAAFRWSTELPGLKLLLTQVFTGANVPLSDTALACEGMALGGRPEEHIRALSPRLSGALLIPLRSAQANLGLRADFDFFIISEKPLRTLAGKPLAATDLLFETSGSDRANLRYSVFALRPGAPALDLSGTRAMLAVQHHCAK